MDQSAQVRQALSAIWTRSLEDPHRYLFGDDLQVGLVTTVDEHDVENPVKPFPDRPHLRTLTDLWLPSQQMAVGKSRQMMVSWWAMALVSWELWHPGRQWAVICRRFDDSDALLERCVGIMSRVAIPEGIRPKFVRKQGSIKVMHDSAPSQVLALAQDSDAPRSRTFSGMVVDEAAFTDNLEALYTAAKPTVMSGGKLVLVSSPNGRGLFHRLLTDSGRLEL